MCSWSQRPPTIVQRAFLLQSPPVHERETSQRCTTTTDVWVRRARCRRGLCSEARMEQRSDQRTYRSRTLFGRRDNTQSRPRPVHPTSLDVSGTAGTNARTHERSLTTCSFRKIRMGRLCALASPITRIDWQVPGSRSVTGQQPCALHRQPSTPDRLRGLRAMDTHTEFRCHIVVLVRYRVVRVESPRRFFL